MVRWVLDWAQAAFSTLKNLFYLQVASKVMKGGGKFTAAVYCTISGAQLTWVSPGEKHPLCTDLRGKHFAYDTSGRG